MGCRDRSFDPHYAATSCGQAPPIPLNGVFKSTDGGNTWTLVLATNASGVLIDPQAPDILYANTYLGIFKSSDAGASWSATGWSGKLVIDPDLTTTLYNLTSACSGSDCRPELRKSVDGGASWILIGDGLPGLGPLVFDPQDHDTLYMGIYGNGVFRSTNGGVSWTAMNDGLTNLNVLSLAIDSQTPATLYANTRTASGPPPYNGGVFAITMTPRFRLTVERMRGSGTVTSSPAGIDCGRDCSESLPAGTTVTLTATPARGAVIGWTGCDSDSGAGRRSSCTVTMTGDRSVSATFAGRPSRAPLP